MKTNISGLILALLASAVSVQAFAGPRDQGVNARQQHQQHRMQQGVRSGDLTRGEHRSLQREARDIRRTERQFRADGRFSRSERREVHRDLNHLGRDIQRERHDGDRRFGRREDFRHGPGPAFGHFRQGHGRWAGYGQFRDDRGYRGRPTWGWDPRIDRLQRRQHDRIVSGIRSGELTPSEARELRGEQRDLRRQERVFRSDGVLTRNERREMYEDLNAANRHIYNETHDGETRR